MKLLVGLGNPGEEHKNNRHNVGFMVVDELFLLIKPGSETKYFSMQKKFDTEIFKSGEVILVKPQTFMNSSGKAVKKILDHFKIKTSDLWVIHDDLDIPLGDFKIQKGKGPKLHKGVMSIEKELNKSDFWRVRVGVENR
ncbi:MAG: aminoacyl-tRNA hydrolase, partial [Patescibacteria group bacterium]